MDGVQADLREFIVGELAGRDPRSELEPDASLIGSGLLDSISLLRLIVFIEERYGVKVEDVDVVPANFESLRRVEDFVDGKRQAAGVRPTPG